MNTEKNTRSAEKKRKKTRIAAGCQLWLIRCVEPYPRSNEDLIPALQYGRPLKDNAPSRSRGHPASNIPCIILNPRGSVYSLIQEEPPSFQGYTCRLLVTDPSTSHRAVSPRCATADEASPFPRHKPLIGRDNIHYQIKTDAWPVAVRFLP